MSDPGRTGPRSGAEAFRLADLPPPAGHEVIDLTDDREVPLAGFAEPRSGVRVELHHPLESPALWRDYLDGAEAQYSAHGVTAALRRDELESGRAVPLFFVALDGDRRAVGGIRCHGPLQVVSEAYACSELAGQPRLHLVRQLLARTVPAGVVELKGAWVDRGRAPRGVSDALARCHVHAMNWFGARYAMCTASEQVAARWASTGGRPFADLDTVPYPDERYRTVLLWWDRDRLTTFADPDQWSAIVQEGQAVVARADRHPTVPAAPVPLDQGGWRPEVLDERNLADAVRLLELRSDAGIELVDHLDGQLRALREIRPPVALDLDADRPRWVHYPWRRTVVRVLGPRSFRALRLDRNRNKITPEEQERLGRLRIGVVGLSVGHAIAHTLALEGICGALRLADFDQVELSNLNRIPATVLDLGVNKAVAVARRIAELDPYLPVEVLPDGVEAVDAEAFVDGLDVVVEECDSLDVKALVRDAARARGVPVVMETSDRGLLDVERYDLEPDRPLFHGLLGDVRAAELVGLSTHDKVPHVLRILEPEQLSSRMAASMAEIDETLTTWPQLGGDVMLGGATVAAAVRAIGLGEPLPSGRARVDLRGALGELRQPAPPTTGPVAPVVVPPVPDDPHLAVAHAAHLAPSGGNVQPWTIDLDRERLRIHLDPSRTTLMDVRFRGSLVAIGAALLNARAAAAARGLLGPVAAFPDGPGSDVVAELRFADGRDAELADAYPRVLDRSTNRRAGDPRPLPAELVEQLHGAVAAEGARLHLLTGRDAIADYAELLAESDRLRFLSPRLHAEMVAELRWPGVDRFETGIDVRTLELDEADLAKLAVGRRSDVMAELASWDGGRALGDTTRERVPTSSAVAAVAIRGTDPAGYVAGGAAVQRLWLAAEAAGLAVQPVSPISVFAADDDDLAGLVASPYVERLRSLSARLRSVLGLAAGENLALVVRLSHAAPPSLRSGRRPLGEVLRH